MISLTSLNTHLNTEDDPTHEYISLQIVNEYTPGNTEPKPIIFNQIKSSNIVDVARDYYLSVVRWNIQSNLPVLIPDMVISPTPTEDITLATNYKLQLLYSTYAPFEQGRRAYNKPTYNVGSMGTPVLFKPEINDPSIYTLMNPTIIPNRPRTKQELLSNPWYYLKNVNSLLRMLNDAISDCFLDIEDDNKTWIYKPYFIWDSNSNKISFYRPNTNPTGIPGGDATTQWYVAVNQPLYNLLSTFRFIHYKQNNTVTGNPAFPPTDCNFLLDTNILPLNALSTGDYTVVTQQTSSVVNWSPVSSIIFQTGLPVESQISGASVNLNTNSDAQSSVYAQNNTTKVITDFIIPFANGTEATNQQIYYINTSEYRLIDLLGNQALIQLQIQIFWKDVYGSLHPMTLDAGQSADILILLRKKNYR